jgi:hypothetical protein
MVTRILRYESSLDSNENDGQLDSKSPGSGKRWEVREVYSDGASDIDYSLSYEERKLFDNIQGDRLADEDNGLPFDLTVGASEDLAILGSDTSGASNTGRFFVVVDEMSG